MVVRSVISGGRRRGVRGGVFVSGWAVRVALICDIKMCSGVVHDKVACCLNV